jgi:murein DD-endopeptidase MepM/ murein hydrolase activator NlpD
MKKETAVQLGNQLKEALTLGVFLPLLSEAFLKEEVLYLDLSSTNNSIQGMNMSTVEPFKQYIKKTFETSGKTWGIGGYGEKRTFYGASENFHEMDGARNIHLGIDLWVPSGSVISAPLDGILHSFQDNNKFLDYGPTIILEHILNGVTFYTLYGHLSRASLAGIHQGMHFSAGQKIGEVGNESENGGWPAHLHFQIVGDMLGMQGDFIGVASENEKDMYLSICPDPKLMMSF